MIARTWHGVTPSSKADAYMEFLHRTGVPDYKATPGNRGVYVLRRIEGFAGEDVEKAVYYPEDPEFLLEMEPDVTHYEVLVQP